MLAVVTVAIGAQQPPAPGHTADGAQTFDSSTRAKRRPIAGPKFRVVPMKGLSYPYALAFLPDGACSSPSVPAGPIVRNGHLILSHCRMPDARSKLKD